MSGLLPLLLSLGRITGRGHVALYPKDFIEQTRAGLPEETPRKPLQTNSARLYHLEV